MDTVRADHLSSYGYFRETSPNLSILAKQGVLFENAFSAAEWSYPSHASIFTGKYPSFHKTLGRDISLHEENATTAEILSLNGYQTFGITGNTLLSPTNRFDKGFQRFTVLDTPYRSLEFVKQSPKDFIRTLIYGLDWYTYRGIEMIVKFLSKRDTKTPFFLFSNFFTCHAPYDPPRPFKRRFCSSLYEPKFYLMEYLSNKILGHTGEKISGSRLDPRTLNLIASDDGQYSFMARELQVSQEEWDFVKSWYDGCISYLDYRLGQLIGFLKETRIFDNTLIIVTSDHGESFGEHGLASHQFCLYDCLLHVPLMMVYPNAFPRRRRVSSLVSTVDILPTILDVLNIGGKEGYKKKMQGKSLLPFREQKIHNFICAECGESVTNMPTNWVKFDRRLRPKLNTYDKGSKCLRTESHKYILSADQKEELYDIRTDPFEKTNIASEYPEIAGLFRKQLENTIDVSFFGPRETPLGKQAKEIVSRLQALGYI